MKITYDPNQLSPVFTATWEQYSERNGQPFTYLRPTENDGISDDHAQLHLIQFEDGIIIAAWPEEIYEHV